VFSKEQLYDKIWGEDMYGDIKTVAVHINRLREKIEHDPANPIHIQTLWGAGYRFMA
jgi:DNA-binding response OmpR family regulator